MTAGHHKSEAEDPLVGTVLDDRYELCSLMAKGAMGAVYIAKQAPLGRNVAIKLMEPQYLHTSMERFEERFLLEARVIAKLQHPNVVRVYDYGRFGDRPYLVMEYIDGYSLQRLQAGGPIPPARLVHIAVQICDALEEAHSFDLIHRDLKPANILLTRHAGALDVVKVVDFGLAKSLYGVDPEITDAGQVMGTPMYMAPEQIRDETCDGRTDIYALGMLMYRSLTGRLPFNAGQTAAVLMANLQEIPPPFAQIAPSVNVPGELERIVMQCLEKNPDHRFPSVRVLREALRRLDAEPGDPPSVITRFRPPALAQEDSSEVPSNSGYRARISSPTSHALPRSGSMQLSRRTPGSLLVAVFMSALLLGGLLGAGMILMTR